MITTTTNEPKAKKITWYDAPTLRLKNMTHTGGIIQVQEYDDKIILIMEQMVGGTSGTQWVKSTHEHTIELWNQYKSHILKDCIEQKK